MENSINPNSALIFYVNGKKVEDLNVDPEWTLLYYLRKKLKLTGTKLGCGEGGCGACTVMVSWFDRTARRVIHYSINACLAPVCSFHGLAVTTVEGIGSVSTKIHPVQERISKAYGSQCGFCTPGIVMSMYTLLRSLPGKPSFEDLQANFQGNICRCTGYRPIIEGFRTFTEEWEQDEKNNQSNDKSCVMGGECCLSSTDNGEVCPSKKDPEMADRLLDPKTLVPYDPSQEPIFPPELKISSKLDSQFLVIRGPRVVWFRPTTLSGLMELKSRFPSAKMIMGGVDIGICVQFKNQLYPELIHSNRVPELTEVSLTDNGLRVGAGTSLSALETILKKNLDDLPGHRTKVFLALFQMLQCYGGKQIRNASSLGGHIMSKSHPSDLNPTFMAAGCQLELFSEVGKRVVPFNSNFLDGFVLKSEEIILALIIPYSAKNQYFASYKQSKKRGDDFAIVNAAFNLFLDRMGNVLNIEMAFEGIKSTTVLAPKTSWALKGKLWTSDVVESVFSTLIDELDPEPAIGMVAYRYSLTLSLLFKFYLFVAGEMEKNNVAIEKVPDSYKSGRERFKHLRTKGSQYFELAPDSQSKTDMVGRPIIRLTAFRQTTGEAVYCDDIPDWKEQLYLKMVYSSRGYARILNIDPSAALALPGVHAFFCSKDLPGDSNLYGAVVDDDRVFAEKVVECIGQIIGAVVADNALLARRAAKLVKVEYEDLQPIIVSIEDAVRKNAFYPSDTPIVIRSGNPEEAFSSAEHVVEGEVKIEGQEHFYLETMACVVVPKGEDDELEIIASTQNLTDIQVKVARMLNIDSNRVVVKTKLIGGGFGAKGHRTSMVVLPCALAAKRLGKPVRCMLDRDEDMFTTGERHPFLAQYKVAFQSDGKLIGCIMKMYNSSGRALDVADTVMIKGMLHYENAYYFPNVLLHGYVCKTNISPNCALRGYGAPQAMFFGETMITHVAAYLKMDPLKLRSLNMYKEGQSTHYGQKLINCNFERCWQQVLIDSNYHSRKMDVQKFNKNNRWRKRGIYVVPTKFGAGYGSSHLNHGGALVLVYRDGSVLLSHGGIEMGQGLHTKMVQVASTALGIPVSEINTIWTGTDTVPNAEHSAASCTSDVQGAAVLDACRKLLKRLEPYKNKDPGGKWKDWVKAAYFDRVSLSATGYYKTPNIYFDKKKGEGIPYNYFTYGAGCSEVEIDCLTGDHQVLRTDLVMDVGESINPGLDVGQVEGAFTQGYGMFTMEELVHSSEGELLSQGPGTYKVPGFTDVPGEFNVCLLKGASNPLAVYSSKAVGEPPLFLAASVFFAIREAVEAARAEVGLEGYFRFDSPATAAQIRMACADQITEKVPESVK